MTDETTLTDSDDPALLPGTPEERAAEAAHGMSAISLRRAARCSRARCGRTRRRSST